MTVEEKRAAIRVQREGPNRVDGSISCSASLAERAIKKRRMVKNASNGYMDTRFILPTSNICTRLFSKAGYALHDRRKGILPCNFQMQIFLHVNHSLWNISDVRSILE